MRGELIARVESATHGSLILDVDLLNHLWPKWAEDEDVDKRFVTSSVDAALALLERVLPGAYIELSGPRKYLNIPTPAPNYWRAAVNDWDEHSRNRGWGATPALALLSALLRALPEPQDPPQ